MTKLSPGKSPEKSVEGKVISEELGIKKSKRHKD
jgi:hypothetical protein